VRYRHVTGRRRAVTNSSPNLNRRRGTVAS